MIQVETTIPLHKVRRTPKKRLPAIANSAVWEKVTKGRTEIRGDNVVDTVWKGIGNQEDMLSMEKFGGHKTQAKERIERRKRLAVKRTWKGKNVKIYT